MGFPWGERERSREGGRREGRGGGNMPASHQGGEMREIHSAIHFVRREEGSSVKARPQTSDLPKNRRGEAGDFSVGR